jgi:mannose-6-phosphate isomerase-like protein (cupin superfamily)
MRLKGVTMRLAVLVFCAAVLAAGPAPAQVRATPPDGYIFKSATEIDAALSKSQTGSNSIHINDHENYYIEILKRLDHGNAVELHPHWIDQVTVISGEGTLTFGGTVNGGTVAPNGEVRGGTQVGTLTQELRPGDFVLIPAGQAHTFNAAPGKTLTYVVAKARQ